VLAVVEDEQRGRRTDGVDDAADDVLPARAAPGRHRLADAERVGDLQRDAVG